MSGPRPTMGTVVAVHGFSDSGACMVPFLRRWCASGRGPDEAVTPDLVAHSGRPMPAGTAFSHATLTADLEVGVRAAAERAGSPVVLLGHSLGASTAAGVAATAPALVQALVLEDPPWSLPRGAGDDDEAESANPHRPWLAGLQGTDHAGRLAWLAANNPGWPADEADPWAEAKAAVDLRLFDAPQHWLRRRWAPVVDEIRCPVLLLVGEPSRDAACTAGAAAALAQRPGWDVETVRGAGHNVRRDRPGRTVGRVSEALERWGLRRE